MSAGDDPDIRVDELPGNRLRRIRRARAAKVVHAFAQDEPPDAGLAQHVALEPFPARGSDTDSQHAVAADAGVQHRNVCRRALSLEAPRQVVRPPVLPVRGGAATIGDGVAQDH